MTKVVGSRVPNIGQKKNTGIEFYRVSKKMLKVGGVFSNFRVIKRRGEISGIVSKDLLEFFLRLNY